MSTAIVLPKRETEELQTQLKELLIFLESLEITETPGIRGLSALIADVKAIGEVNCVHRLERAEILIVELRRYQVGIEEKLEKPTQYSHRIHSFFTNLRARFAGQAETEARKLAGACGAYRQRLAEEARRREESERREAQRIADEENARRRKEYEAEIEAERRRIAEQRVTEAVEVAARLEAEGRAEEANALLSNAAKIASEVIEMSLPEPELAVPAPVAVAEPVAKAQGVGYRRKWKFRIINATLIQREYLQPDEQKIRKIVEAMGRDAPVRGIEVYEDQVASVKRK